MAKVIAVDFDGTLCERNFPDIGAPIMSVIEYVKRKKEQGDTLILWTCRVGAQTYGGGRVVQTIRLGV